MKPVELAVSLLSQDMFAPYGDVIETAGANHFSINNGTTERFHALAMSDVEQQGGRTIISIFEGQPFRLPITIAMMEKHPLGSQAFMPLSGEPYLVVVAVDDGEGRPLPPQAFLANPKQGVNYHRDIWHHPLISLNKVCRFIVIDREGEGENLVEANYSHPGYAIANLSSLNTG